MTEPPNGPGPRLPPPPGGDRHEPPLGGRDPVADARAAGLRRRSRRAAATPAPPATDDGTPAHDRGGSFGSMFAAAAWPGSGTASLHGPAAPDPAPDARRRAGRDAEAAADAPAVTGDVVPPPSTTDAARPPLTGNGAHPPGTAEAAHAPAIGNGVRAPATGIASPSAHAGNAGVVGNAPFDPDSTHDAGTHDAAAHEVTTDLGHVRAALARSSSPPLPVQATSRLPRDEIARGAVAPSSPGARREERPVLVVSALAGGIGASTLTGMLRAELSRRFGSLLPLRHRGDDDAAARVAAPSLPPAPPELPTLVDAGPHGLDRTRVRDGPIVLVCDASPASIDAATALLTGPRAEGTPVLALAVVTRSRRRTARPRHDDRPGPVRRIDIPFDPAIASRVPIDTTKLGAETAVAIGELADAILTTRTPARTA